MNDPRLGVLFAFFDDPGLHLIARDRLVDEHRHSINTRQPFAANGKVCDLDLYDLTFFNCHV